ncbi:mechanosensitive ion channel protein MscS, partial [Vibrio parahaemolyticus]
MTFHFPLKNRQTPWVAIFALFITMMTPIFVQATESTEPPIISEAEASIDSLNIDIVDLSQSLSQTAGDERDALQLQLFQKNEELRNQLASA